MAAIDSLPCPPPETARNTGQQKLRARHQVAVAVFSAAILSTMPTMSSADDDWEPTNYEKRFETPKNGLRLKDNNVWVYKRSFSERFGMPKRWIDDNLEGAKAVAYRVEAKNTRSCGYFGESDNCRTNYYCIFDLYLSDADSKKLAWKTDRTMGFAKEDTSVPFLSAQSRSDQKGWVKEEQRYDRSRLNIGVDTMSWVSGPPTEDKVFSASSDRVRVQSYDRDIFEGLDYVELTTDCSIARRENNVRIFFQEEFPSRDDFDVSYEELRNGTTDKAIQYRAHKETWFRRLFKGDVQHIVSFPDEYMSRINEYDRRVYKPQSLATEVEKRLGESGNPDERNEEWWWHKLFGL